MKAVLVTGAGGAIGSAIASLARARGWAVIAAQRDRAATLQLPLDEPDRFADVLATVDASLDVAALVLCASPPPLVSSFTKTPSDALVQQLQINVVAAHRLLAECWKRFFRPRKGGHVVAFSTAALGPPPTPHLVSYLVGKAAVEALVEAALAELGPAGLRGTVIRPGFTETPMLRAFPTPILDAARQSTRFLTPAEVAAATVDALDQPPAEPLLRRIELP